MISYFVKSGQNPKQVNWSILQKLKDLPLSQRFSSEFPITDIILEVWSFDQTNLQDIYKIRNFPRTGIVANEASTSSKYFPETSDKLILLYETFKETRLPEFKINKNSWLNSKYSRNQNDRISCNPYVLLLVIFIVAFFDASVQAFFDASVQAFIHASVHAFIHAFIVVGGSNGDVVYLFQMKFKTSPDVVTVHSRRRVMIVVHGLKSSWAGGNFRSQPDFFRYACVKNWGSASYSRTNTIRQAIQSWRRNERHHRMS